MDALASLLSTQLRSSSRLRLSRRLETSAMDTCFPNVSQKHCFQQQNMFLLHGRNIFAYGNNISRRVAKLGNMEKTYVRSKCFWQHVSSFCQGLRGGVYYLLINVLSVFCWAVSSFGVAGMFLWVVLSCSQTSAPAPAARAKMFGRPEACPVGQKPLTATRY